MSILCGGGRHKGFSPTPSLGGLNIYGGQVEAIGGAYAAGIGSGDEMDSSDAFAGYINIYGGDVKARNRQSAASIDGDAIQNYGSLTGDKDADGYFRYTTKGDGTVSISLVKAPEDAWLASWTLRLDGNKLSGSDAGIAYTLQPATEAQEELISKFDAEWHGGNGEDYEWKWGHPGEDR